MRKLRAKQRGNREKDEGNRDTDPEDVASTHVAPDENVIACVVLHSAWPVCRCHRRARKASTPEPVGQIRAPRSWWHGSKRSGVESSDSMRVCHHVGFDCAIEAIGTSPSSGHAAELRAGRPEALENVVRVAGDLALTARSSPGADPGRYAAMVRADRKLRAVRYAECRSVQRIRFRMDLAPWSAHA